MSDVVPSTRYARTADCEIAYQVSGAGPLDLVFIPNSVSNVELLWELPANTRLLRGAGSFSRLIAFDRRGSGLSGPPPRPVTCLEDWMDDAIAVMDDLGSGRAALWGAEAGGPMAVLLAATYPERVSAVVLMNTYARFAWAPDYPFGVPHDVIDELALPSIEQHWGDGFTYAYANPQIRHDPVLLSWFAKVERFSMTPMNAAEHWRTSFATDVRDILPNVQAPVLLMHATGNPAIAVEHARYMAARIPRARLVEYEDDSHAGFMYEHADFVLDEMQAFLTGERHLRQPDRVLASVLFTDIVGSTELASRLGDHRWMRRLEEHDRLVAEHVERCRGRLVKHTGDGVLATFDGPARGLDAARSIRAGARSSGLEVRAGLHTGEVELRGDDVGGIAVHLAARISALAGASEILVSRTVKDLVIGSGIAFDDRGVHRLKGVPEAWQLYRVAES